MTSAAVIDRIPALGRGDALDSPWPDAVRGGVAAAAFFIGLLGWAAFTPLDAAVVAHGTVVVSGNRQAVQHLDGGIVRALHVKEGDQVREGDVLLELVGTELASQVEALGARLVELEAHEALIAAENAGRSTLEPPARWASLPPAEKAAAEQVMTRQHSELQARLGAAGARIGVLNRQMQELQARLPGQQEERSSALEQVRLLDDEIKSLSGLLDKGLTTVSHVRALQRERASLQGRVGRIDAETAQTHESISETESQIASLSAELRAKRAEELRDVTTQLGEVGPKFAATQAQMARTQLRAPASGQVVALTAFTVGGVIQPGAHVMDIVPTGRRLVIDAEVKPENGDELHTHTPAKIRFPGLKGRDVPVLQGEVSQVSADRIVEPSTGRAFFRIEITVGEGELKKIAETINGKTAEIRPGIPAEVVLPLRKRTALQYFYEPLAQSLWKSFREE